MSRHPVYGITGQPVPIPGSMGDDSYRGVATDRAARTLNSVNHGAGRVLDKPDAKRTFTEQSVVDELRSREVRLYRTGSSDISEQAPRSFKDITAVVRTMEMLDLASLVVRVRPVAVLKG
jgi:tRNA-splicing ligase RtcB